MVGLELPRVVYSLLPCPLLTAPGTVKCGATSRHRAMGAFFQFRRQGRHLWSAMTETDGTTSRQWRRQLPFGSPFHFRWVLQDNLDLG